MIGTFEKELAELLNRHGRDISANTPDFILAAYLVDCLASYRRIRTWNSMWHSEQGVPVKMQEHGPPMMRG